ncbi:MAG TPA: hypothetical protein VH853_23140 [Polyangia bacterium]|nr:hypothetical protein [Polyangia bacterium]
MLRAAPVWDGILGEFRNHLTALLAVASEIRAAAPLTGPGQIAGALAETEWNIQRLDALVGFVDGVLRDGTPVIADLDDVVERALRLAAPTLGRTSVSVHKERRTGVSNRGSALESLLAALLVELVRAEGKGVSAGERPLQIEIHVEVTRSTMFLSIESDGRRPSVESWRFALASDLASRLGATVATLPDGAGYLVRLT